MSELTLLLSLQLVLLFLRLLAATSNIIIQALLRAHLLCSGPGGGQDRHSLQGARLAHCT